MSYEGLSLNFDCAGQVAGTAAASNEEGEDDDEMAKAKSNASLRFMPTSMGSTKKAVKSRWAPDFILPSTSDSSATAPSDSLAPPPVPQAQNRDQVAGKKRPSTFEEWVARPDEEQYNYQAFRPRWLSKKQKKELKKQHIAPKIFTQDTTYELKHPSLDYENFAQSDMAVVINDAWQRRLKIAETKQARLESAAMRPVGPSESMHSEIIDPKQGWQSNEKAGEAHVQPSVKTQTEWDIHPNGAAERLQTDEQKATAEAQKAMAQAKIQQIKSQFAQSQMANIQKRNNAPKPMPKEPSPSPVEQPQSSVTAMSASVPRPDVLKPGQVVRIGPVITAAPLMYAPPQTNDTDMSLDQHAGPRTKATKKLNFGARMLEKQGWEKGKGLGASGEGITKAIVVEAQKRKKLSDAQGGGYATPANMGRIIGGQSSQSQATQEVQMSRVMKISNMLTGMDIDEEIQENSLLQEIGEQMNSHGDVERIFIWRKANGGNDDVFIKFNSPLSTLNALKATDQDDFAGNLLSANFFDEQKFEDGIYGS